MLDKTDLFTKRLFDITFSIVGLGIFSPFLGIIALSIKLDSKGPIFYRGERLGKCGRLFAMYKFRTMVDGAEKKGVLATPEGDPRVTRLGRFLRSYKLDELPQLWNILKGEMSLVGPRPEGAIYFQYYTKEEKITILSVLPGITDPGTLRFHDEGKLLAGTDDPIKLYVETIKDEKVKLQMEYIKNRSLWTDLTIILATLKTIVSTRFLKKET